MGRRRGVPERERCVLLHESTFHQQIYNSGGFFPGWMHQLVPYACDGSDLGCRALVPVQHRGVSARGHELRSPGAWVCSAGAGLVVGSCSHGEENNTPQLNSLLIAALHAALPLLSKFGGVITAAGQRQHLGSPPVPSPAFQGFWDLPV